MGERTLLITWPTVNKIVCYNSTLRDASGHRVKEEEARAYLEKEHARYQGMAALLDTLLNAWLTSAKKAGLNVGDKVQ